MHEGEQVKLTKVVSWIPLSEVWSIDGITWLQCTHFCYVCVQDYTPGFTSLSDEIIQRQAV